MLGAIGVVFGLFDGLRLLTTPSASFGVLVLALAVGQAVVLYGLWTLKSWAWVVALVFYGLGALLDLFQLDVVGLLISLVVVAYVHGKAEYYL